MRVLLVRHGETTWNAERRMQGEVNAPLNARGRAQAAGIAEAVAAYGATHIETSDLDRTIDTATLAGLPDGLRLKAWREMHMGAWQGQMAEDVDAAERVAWSKGLHTPPGGESLAEFVARIRGALDCLPRDQPRCLIVCHGLVIKAALHSLFEIPYAKVGPVVNCSLTEIDWTETDRPRLLRFNDVRWQLDD